MFRKSHSFSFAHPKSKLLKSAKNLIRQRRNHKLIFYNISKPERAKVEIDFNHQTGRVPSKNVVEGVFPTANDNRFNYMPIDAMGRTPSPPAFNKVSPRKDLMIIKHMSLIDYPSEYETIKNCKKNGSKIFQYLVVEMDKMKNRNELIKTEVKCKLFGRRNLIAQEMQKVYKESLMKIIKKTKNRRSKSAFFFA